MEKIKKCPFCNSKAKLVQKYDFLYVVECSSCHCQTQHMTEERVIQAWNTRPSFDFKGVPYIYGIGNRIRFLRKNKMELSMIDMAKKFGENWTVISAWEHGNKELTPDEIIRLSEFFGCTTDYLMKGGKPE